MARRNPLHLELDPKVPAHPDGSDRAPRWLLRLRVQGSLPNTDATFLVHNLSATGLLIETSAELSVGSVFRLDLPSADMTEARVEWASGNLFGCSFETPISTATIAAALLKNPLTVGQTAEASAGPSRAEPPANADPKAAEAGLPARLRSLRQSRGLSLDSVASRVEVSRQTVWYWETGRRIPSHRNLELLADALGVTVSELLRKGEEEPPNKASALAEIKNRIADELGVSPQSVEIHIRL